MKVIKPILLNILVLQCSIITLAQNRDSLLSVVEKNKDQKIDSLIGFNADKNKLQYLAILPSVNYNFLDNTFNLGISLSNLSTFYQNRQRNKIELDKLKFQLIEKKENELLALEKEYELLIDSYDILKLELSNSSLTNEIFHLKKAQYENNKINLEDWLNVQKNYQDRKIAIFAKGKSIISKMKQFEVKIKAACFTNEITFLTENIQ